MPKIEDLNQAQLDVLRELGNIGSGNAATALAQFLNRRIDMEVPQIKILPFAEVSSCLGEPNTIVTGVYLNILGDIRGQFLLIFPEKTAVKFVKILWPASKAKNVSDMNDLERSCLREIGNILAGAFLSALTSITGINMVSSIPAIKSDMVGAILDSVVLGNQPMGDSVLLINTSYIEGGENLAIHIFLMPNEQALTKLLEKLGFK